VADFSKISNPLAPKDPSRNIVAKQTHALGGARRNQVNRGPFHDNPQHAYASRLEGRQGGAGQYETPKRVIMTAGSERATPSHAYSRTPSYHSHFGTANSRKAHSFAGRRK
jgi:hypothetical protein